MMSVPRRHVLVNLPGQIEQPGWPVPIEEPIDALEVVAGADLGSSPRAERKRGQAVSHWKYLVIRGITRASPVNSWYFGAY